MVIGDDVAGLTRAQHYRGVWVDPGDRPPDAVMRAVAFVDAIADVAGLLGVARGPRVPGEVRAIEHVMGYGWVLMLGERANNWDVAVVRAAAAKVNTVLDIVCEIDGVVTHVARVTDKEGCDWRPEWRDLHAATKQAGRRDLRAA